MPRVVEPALDKSAEFEQIYVASHGWHTGIVIPAHHLLTVIPQIEARFDGVDFLEIGWGDSGFYQANEITTRLTIRAMFLPTDSVVHVVGFTGDPAAYFANSEIKAVKVNSSDLQTLLKFVSSSFDRNSNSDIIALRRGIYGNSQFYSGVGHYFAFNTCNKWTAKALYSAGISNSPAMKLTASSVMRILKGRD